MIAAMAVATPTEAREDHLVEPEEAVTPLELFYDLVFVFALTQVTRMLADDTSPAGLARGLLVLGAMWWAWVGYSWLTSSVFGDEDGARLTMFAAMAGVLVASLAVPGAFGDDALLFALAYTVVRALHILLYGLAANDVSVRRSVVLLAPSTAVSCSLILAASAFDGVTQGALWAVALLVDYAGPALVGIGGWKVFPSHFAERHGLFVIIALGESIVAIGVGAEDVALGAGELVAAALGIAIVAALWWAYFDVVAAVAERRLVAARGAERNRLARDSYSYLHLPMIVGIVLLALGVKKTLAHVGDPLAVVPAIGLCGGVALYLLGHVAFRWRNAHSLSRTRIVAAAACLSLIPLAIAGPALAALAAVAAVCTALIGYERIAYQEARAGIRAAH